MMGNETITEQRRTVRDDDDAHVWNNRWHDHQSIQASHAPEHGASDLSIECRFAFGFGGVDGTETIPLQG